MGWEYHNRPRDDNGRWKAKHDKQLVCMHFKFRQEIYDELRRKANDARLNMTEYVEAVLIERWKRDREPRFTY